MSSGTIDRLLQRLVLLALLCLLGLLCGLVWQVNVAVSRIARDLDEVRTGVHDVRQDVTEFMRGREVRAVGQELIHIAPEVIVGGGPPSENAPEEIAYLLARVLHGGRSFRMGDDSVSTLRLYGQLAVKQKAYQRAISSAEDFIDNVATSMHGKTYHVVHDDDGTTPLADWLRGQLAEYRQRSAAE